MAESSRMVVAMRVNRQLRNSDDKRGIRFWEMFWEASFGKKTQVQSLEWWLVVWQCY